MKTLNTYIDSCIIDEYADKDFSEGYSLDVGSLSEHEIENFLDRLMQHDTDVRDFVLHSMQKLIDSRLPVCESRDRENSGLRYLNLDNGDYSIVRGAA